MSKTSVSVIIPTYNGERTIERAIKSVLIQKHIVEVLVMDDISTDKTGIIIRGYNDERVKFILNQSHTGGPNEGRNKGIDIATGKYIAFLDQDDEWHARKIDRDLCFLEEKADMVYSEPVGSKEKRKPYSLYRVLRDRDKRYVWPYMSSIVVRNKDIPHFETKYGMLDMDWLLKLSSTRLCIPVTPLVTRYMTGSNLSLNRRYRSADFREAKGHLSEIGWKRYCSSKARYHYLMGEMRDARSLFIRGDTTFKNVLYYLTSFFPPLGRFISNRFKVFG